MIEGMTLRDYFAGQALASMPERVPPADYVHRAYAIADQMLVRREKDGGRRDHEIEELTRRAATAELKLAVIQEATENALSEIYRFLDVRNHAEAMDTLRIWEERTRDRA